MIDTKEEYNKYLIDLNKQFLIMMNEKTEEMLVDIQLNNKNNLKTMTDFLNNLNLQEE